MLELKRKWKKISEKVVFKNRIELVEHKVRTQNGQITSYLVEHGNGAVAILISPKKGYVFLTYQYRYPLDMWIYDLPGGGIKKGENIKTAVIRECKEEVGVTPKMIINLGKVYVNPSRVDWPFNLFFATEFKIGEKTVIDLQETVYRKLISIKKLEKAIRKNEIVDPGIIIAFTIARLRGLI